MMPRGRRRAAAEQDPPMAGEPTPEEQGRGNQGHNMKSRAEEIRAIAAELNALNEQRASITKQMSDIKQTRIKAGLNMKISDFAMAMRLQSLEDDDRSASIDAMREIFAAMVPGQQLDWIEATKTLTDVAEAPDAQGGGFTEEVGFQAGKAGKAATTNPHPVGTPSHQLWREGWMRGQEANAAEMAGA